MAPNEVASCSCEIFERKIEDSLAYGPYLLFKVVVHSASERIRFLTEFPWPKADEGGEELRPSSLPSDEHLGSREVFKIPLIRNDVDRVVKGLEVMPPGPEGFEYGEKLLAMCVIIGPCTIERAAVECDGVNLAVVRANGENSRDRVVGGVRFYYWR